MQILDYYHGKEYLCEFVEAYFSKKEKRKKWIIKQEKRLYKDQVDKVIEDIQKLSAKKVADSAIKRKILTNIIRTIEIECIMTLIGNKDY